MCSRVESLSRGSYDWVRSCATTVGQEGPAADAERREDHVVRDVSRCKVRNERDALAGCDQREHCAEVVGVMADTRGEALGLASSYGEGVT